MRNLRGAAVALLCVIFLSLLIGACEDDGPTQPKRDMELVGTWKLTKMSSEYEGVTETFTEDQLDSMGVVWTLKIEDDGTMEQITNISGPLVTSPGTWSTSVDQLTMILIGPTGEPGTIVFEYVIDGNILKLHWGILAGTKLDAEFTKQ